ncbi:MAG: glycosyltransferase family 39 protein [Bdellovibrionales bacterium]|nr:glycosyltransferase family 39 protein [Bdellovibrionales bacterium]
MTVLNRWFAPIGLLAYMLLQIPFIWSDQRYNGSEGVYWQVLRQLAYGRELYSEVYCSQFPLFIELARLGRFLPLMDLTAARLLTSLFAPLALWGFYTLLRRYFDRNTSLLAAALLAVDPLFFNLAHQFTGEIPGLALTLWGAYFFLRAQDGERKWALFSAAILSFFVAIQIKQVMFLLLLTFCVLWIKNAGFPGRQKASRVSALILGVGLANVLCLWIYGYQEGQGLRQIQGGHFLNFLSVLFSTPHHLPVGENIDAIATTADYSRMWLYVSVPLFALSLAVLWRRYHFMRDLLLAAVLLSVPLFLYVVINPDHTVLYSPLIALPLALLIAEKRFVLPYVFVAAAVLFSGSEYNWRFPRANKLQRRSVQALQENTSPSSVVMGNVPFSITAAGRLTPPQFTDLSPARLITRSVTCDILEERFQKGDVEAFVYRFKGMEWADCPMEELVRKYFPKVVYEDSKQLIFKVR